MIGFIITSAGLLILYLATLRSWNESERKLKLRLKTVELEKTSFEVDLKRSRRSVDGCREENNRMEVALRQSQAQNEQLQLALRVSETKVFKFEKAVSRYSGLIGRFAEFKLAIDSVLQDFDDDGEGNLSSTG